MAQIHEVVASLQPGERAVVGRDVVTKGSRGLMIRESGQRWVFKVVRPEGAVVEIEIDPSDDKAARIAELRAQGFIFVGRYCSASKFSPCQYARLEGKLIIDPAQCTSVHPMPPGTQHPEAVEYPRGLESDNLKAIILARCAKQRAARHENAKLQPEMQRARDIAQQTLAMADIVKGQGLAAATPAAAAELAQVKAENVQLRTEISLIKQHLGIGAEEPLDFDDEPRAPAKPDKVKK